jgi:hypothetical protein
MNITSKLGEDLAADDTILLSASAYAALTQSGRQFIRRTQVISDVTCIFYELQR